MTDLVVRSDRVVTPDGVRRAAIHIADGTIESVRAHDDVGSTEVVEAGGAVVLPGLVDTHVHVNEPGRTEWEGFATATRAAAAGGITTILDMPLNSIPATTDAAALGVKREAARGQCHVDVGFLGGVVPGNAAALGELRDAGVFGFKCFLAPSGVDEFPPVGEGDLRSALPILAARDALLMVHAELPAQLGEPPAGVRQHAAWLASRPVAAEREAVALVARLAREFRAPAHIVHLSAVESLGPLRAARRDGVRLSVETCPHYLTFAAEEIPDGATDHKCAPPIRGAAEREALWDALRDGAIDQVVSDHSPSLPALKCIGAGDFTAAWGGIASLEIGLSAVWTGAAARGFAIEHVVRWMAEAPARLVGLTRKGRIAPGCDADLVIFEPDGSWTVGAAPLHSRQPLTPYRGRTLRGIVRTTLLRGLPAFDRGHFGPPSGRLLHAYDRLHRSDRSGRRTARRRSDRRQR